MCKITCMVVVRSALALSEYHICDSEDSGKVMNPSSQLFTVVLGNIQKITQSNHILYPRNVSTTPKGFWDFRVKVTRTKLDSN